MRDHEEDSPRTHAAMASDDVDRHFVVDYLVSAETEEEARSQARKIAHEQTVELPDAYVAETYPDISANVVGKLVRLEEEGAGLWKLSISYHEDTTGMELNQFLNVVFGNTSIKPKVQVQDIHLSPGLVEAFPGPRFGSDGLRELCGVAKGEPLVMTALKPMGLSVDQLAHQTYCFAKGGIDIIKDDHGLSNQPWAPFEERVRACAAAVKRANDETGRTSLYAPTLSGPIDKLFSMAAFAKKHGAGAVLMLPGITGFDSMRALAADDSFGLPILCHPALLGCMLGGSLTPGCLHGFAHDVILSLIPQISGADATIFPNVGGRFGFTLAECQSIVSRCRERTGPYKPIAATPGGGMTLDRCARALSTPTTTMPSPLSPSLSHSQCLLTRFLWSPSLVEFLLCSEFPRSWRCLGGTSHCWWAAASLRGPPISWTTPEPSCPPRGEPYSIPLWQRCPRPRPPRIRWRPSGGSEPSSTPPSMVTTGSFSSSRRTFPNLVQQQQRKKTPATGSTWL